MKRKLATLVMVLLFLGTFYLPRSGAWQAGGVQLCTSSTSKENPKICSDGAQGAIIVWEDYRDEIQKDIYAQRIDLVGDTLWNISGILICSTPEEQNNIQIIGDGFGGAILVWQDYRNGMTNADLYAQRIDSMGVCVWTLNGVPIVNVTKTQESPQLCSDGAGGAVIVWVDLRNDKEDIYAQRILANGSVKWTLNGKPICLEASYQKFPKIISAGAGDFIISWQDNRSYDDIYAQKINSAGVSQWIANGTVVCNATGSQGAPELCSDGAGGAIITWADYRAGLLDGNIYAQRINSAGTPQWTGNGTVICNATLNQANPQLCSDDAGGALIGWIDFRKGLDTDVYAQRITQNEQLEWEINGISICNESRSQNDVEICSDNAGGAIFVWQDDRKFTKDSDVYAQRVSPDGTIQWKFNGAIVSNTTTGEYKPQLVNAGVGAAIFTWQSEVPFDGISMDIYAVRIPLSLGGGNPELILIILVSTILGICLVFFILYKRRELNQ